MWSLLQKKWWKECLCLSWAAKVLLAMPLRCSVPLLCRMSLSIFIFFTLYRKYGITFKLHKFNITFWYWCKLYTLIFPVMRFWHGWLCFPCGQIFVSESDHRTKGWACIIYTKGCDWFLVQYIQQNRWILRYNCEVFFIVSIF